jgi:hypothetical protein
MLKLSFKLEVLYTYLRSINQEQSLLNNTENKKSLGFLGKSNEKHSFRNSNSHTKVGYSSGIEILNGFDNELMKLSQEEKDEFYINIKNYESSYLTSICNIIQNRQFFPKMKNKAFLDILRKFYNDALSKENLFEITNENEFFMCFIDVFSFSELESLEVFDLFKFNENFCFSEQCFVIIVYLLVACEYGNLEECFKLFFEEIFQLINGEEKIMSLNRLKDLGRILGIKEKVLRKVSFDMKLEISSIVDIEKFKLFYSSAASLHDDSLKIAQPLNISGSNSLKKNTKLGSNIINKIHI